MFNNNYYAFIYTASSRFLFNNETYNYI